MSTDLSPTTRSTVHRGKNRAVRDRDELYATLDAGLICHIGIAIDDAVRVVPTGYGRCADTLYLHGSSGARHLREAADGGEVCVTVTVLNGVVYARAAFHCSMNYRSAMIHGRARAVREPDEKWRALHTITEHLAPGTWNHARQPTKRELASTSVIALDLHESGVKIRTGGPNDDAEDITKNSAWAGVLPLQHCWGEPEPCPELTADMPVPAHVTARSQAFAWGQ